MSLRTVGIEFQAKGERETVAAIGRVDSAQKKLASTSNALKSAVEREVTTAANAVRAYKLLRDAGMSYSDVLKGLDQNTKMLGQAHQAHINSLLGVDRSSKSARDSANALAQAFRQQEAQVENASRSYNQLIASINPTVAAQQRMRQVHETVRAALAAEIITRDQAAQTLREYRALSLQSAAGVNSMAAANQFASRSMNGTGMAVQQVGYQVGDFLVQVQSGTNAFVAFGQQATQLVGILPLMGAGFLGLSTGGLIALASGLGIAIPLITAVGAALMRTRQNAEEASGGVATLEDQLKSATQTMQGFRDSIEMANAGLEDQGELAIYRAIQEARRGITEAEQALVSAQAQRGQGSRSARIEAEAELQAAQELLETRRQEYELYIRLRQEAEITAEINERNARQASRVQDIENEIRLLQITLQRGEESVEVQTELNRQARARLVTEMMLEGATADQVVQMIALTREAQALESAVEEAAAAAESLANTNMAAGIAEAGIAAATLAMELGIALSAAQAIAGVSGGVQTATGVATGSIPPWAMEDLPEAPMTDADRAWESYLDRKIAGCHQTSASTASKLIPYALALLMLQDDIGVESRNTPFAALNVTVASV